MLVVSGCVHFVRHVTTTVLETQVFSRIEEFPLWLNCNNLLGGNIIDVLFTRKKVCFWLIRNLRYIGMTKNLKFKFLTNLSAKLNKLNFFVYVLEVS